ncbi:MAG: Amidohydrolase, partial [Actinomycetota bacterium]
ALQFLVDTEGCDRVLLGSNFGGWDAEDGYRQMVEQLDISKDDVNKILGGNAKRIFNL